MSPVSVELQVLDTIKQHRNCYECLGLTYQKNWLCKSPRGHLSSRLRGSAWFRRGNVHDLSGTWHYHAYIPPEIFCIKQPHLSIITPTEPSLHLICVTACKWSDAACSPIQVTMKKIRSCPGKIDSLIMWNYVISVIEIIILMVALMHQTFTGWHWTHTGWIEKRMGPPAIIHVKFLNLQQSWHLANDISRYNVFQIFIMQLKAPENSEWF